MATLAHSQSKRQLSHAVTSSSSKSKFPSAYWIAFLVALVLCWSPSKLLAYFAPWIGILVMLLFTRSKQILIRLLLIFTIWMIILPIYAIITPGFVWHSALLSLFTYGTFIFVLTIPTKPLADKSLFDKILVTARWVLLFESIWGIVQGVVGFMRSGTFDRGNGDVVTGTIRLSFDNANDFSNPMFATNIVLLITFLVPSSLQENKSKLLLILGCIALVLASVVHAIVYPVISLLVTILIFSPTFMYKYSRGAMVIILILSFILVSFFTLAPHNFSRLIPYVQRVFIDRDNSRSQVVENIITEGIYRYPWLAFIGIGPGQFSSRAGLIGTGLYFGGPITPTPIPFLPQGMSEPFERYVIDLWIEAVTNPANASSTFQPFFSWLSIFVEGGMLLTGFVFLTIIGLFWRVWRNSRPVSFRLHGMMLCTSILFILMIGLQENYWEVPQAIFVGAMLIKVSYSYLCYGVARKS